MTAFGRREKRGDWGIASCEIRTTNHRYLELFFRLPDNFTFIEPQLRNLIRTHLQRGKLDCIIRFQTDPMQSATLNINKTLADLVIQKSQEISQQSTGLQSQINPVDVLRWPGVVQHQEIDLTTAQAEILSLFQETLQELIQARAREGQSLQDHLLQRVQEISNNINNIRSKLPHLNENMRNKLLSRCAELKVSLDPQRFEQELVLYLQKIDVTEEIDRITTHLSEVTRTFAAGGMVGRRLDFLMQELNREINTLGSKINDSDISRVVVDLKVLLEQMREQIQNIE